MTRDSWSGEVLKVVFPLLDGEDLASCMCVCWQWRDIAQDEYFWKCACSRRWASISNRSSPPMSSYYKSFITFAKCEIWSLLPLPRLSFDDLKFYIHFCSEERVLYSAVVPAPVLLGGIKFSPPGTSYRLWNHLRGPGYKIGMAIEPRFSIGTHQTVYASVFVGMKDNHKIACIANSNKSISGYVYSGSFPALAFESLDLPDLPFLSGRGARVFLFFKNVQENTVLDVFGIVIYFGDASVSENDVLWLLDLLDWK